MIRVCIMKEYNEYTVFYVVGTGTIYYSLELAAESGGGAGWGG